MRQDDYRDQIATVMADLGVIDRTERIRLYRFARGLLRLGLADLSEPRDRRGRTQAFLDLEAAIRDTERHVAAPPADAETVLPPATIVPLHPPAPWPGRAGCWRHW